MATFRLIVDDVDAALAFYQGHLGFSLKQRMGPVFAQIERDGLEVWVSGPGTSARKPMPDGREPVPGGWNRLVVQVDDIHAMVKTLRDAGIAFRNEPLSGPGGTQVLIEDPSGNPIEVFQPARLS
ncbi:MAG: VOC family protein [Dehalococcoidia bacterium]|nr:VOC family protein [Dehalococcoidia bacterium]MCA9853206.1 VOC family protein [Dehalococcoidia bacterium]